MATLIDGTFDAVVVQVLPFRDPSFPLAAGADAWRNAATAAGARLILFGPMPATTNTGAIPSTVANVENDLLAYVLSL